MRLTPRPFLKWAGGKTQLLQHILPLLPDRFDTYFEPFLGGGAVFFGLARQGRFERAILSDSNPELIDCYLALRDEPDKTIRALRRHAKRHCEKHFYEVRGKQPRSLVQKAARTIYLNKTCFNGLYRVNRKGVFNVPYGDYANPRIVDEENLNLVAGALQNVKIWRWDFERLLRSYHLASVSRAAVYFDPPYIPVSNGSFTSYDRSPFGMEEHRRLALCFRELDQRGVHLVLTNSSAPETYQLYEGFPYKEVGSRRNINRDGAARGEVKDVIIYTQQ